MGHLHALRASLPDGSRPVGFVSLLIFLAGLLSPPFSATVHANLIPSSWNLSASVQELGGIQDVDFNIQVQTPFFNHSQSAALGPSLSTAQYAFNIGETVADYVVNMQHRCVNHLNGDVTANPRCITFGRIILTPSVDVLLTAAIDYSYFLPTDPVGVSLGVTASLLAPFQSLMVMTHSDNTTLAGPHAGSYANNGSAILPAGRTASIQYTMEFFYLSGSGIGLLGTGDGAVHLNMVAIPEPSALAPVSFAAMLMLRGRRHRTIR